MRQLNSQSANKLHSVHLAQVQLAHENNSVNRIRKNLIRICEYLYELFGG